MDETSLPCDVVLLPDDALAARMIAVSKQLEQFGALFILNDESIFPHLSLYMCQLKVADLTKVSRLLANLAAITPVIELEAFRYYQGDKGYIDVEFIHTNALDRFKMAVIDALNPIRDGLRAKDQVRLAETTGLALENLKQYGYKYVGALARPHLTLTRFTEDKTIDTHNLSELGEFRGSFPRLALFEMGDNGTCLRMLTQFSLGKKSQKKLHG